MVIRLSNKKNILVNTAFIAKIEKQNYVLIGKTSGTLLGSC